MLQLAELTEEIKALRRAAIERQARHALAAEEALAWLAKAPTAPKLRQLIEQHGEPDEQYALPMQDKEPLDRRFQATAQPSQGTIVVAVDGSQIRPDRHAPVLYYLLQVGGMIFCYNGEAPRTQSQSSLHFQSHELYDQHGQIITVQLGERRTVAELEYLAQLTAEAHTKDTPVPLLALTDGPLLWPYRGQSDEEINELLPAYFAAFNQLQSQAGMPVGFVERPGGRPLINLLQLIRYRTGKGSAASAEKSADQLSDRELMAHFLAPGERSSWFKRNSKMNKRHAARGHEIWFSYLNVGTDTWPVIARLETPFWVAQQENWSEKLQRVLLHQARVLHGHPYALARAHELALVTHQDQAALDNRLQQHLVAAGVMRHGSVKAEQKAYFGSK